MRRIMYETYDSSPRRRSRLLAPILLGVLMLSVAAAWWITRSRTVPIRRGREIVALFRGDGLSAYWKEPRRQWFLTTLAGKDADKTVGWRVNSVTPDGQGGFVGLEIRGSRDGISWEHWKLNGNATEGAYSAGELLAGRLGMGLGPTTMIKLSAGRVRAIQTIPTPHGVKQYDTNGQAPANYLPEGTLSLARRLVARRRTTARFAMIFNAYPPLPDRPRFEPVLMEYQGQVRSGQFKGAAKLAVSYGTGEKARDVFFLDSDGNVLAISTEQKTVTAASQAEVARHFPEAPVLFRKVADALKVPQTGPATTPANN